MDNSQRFKAIRPFCIEKCLSALDTGSGFREVLQIQLEDFFNALEKNICLSDTTAIDRLVDSWIHSRKQSFIDENFSSLTKFVSTVMLVIFEVSQEKLPAADVVALQNSYMQTINHCMDKISRGEMEAGVQFIREQTEKVKQSQEQFILNKSSFIAVAAHELKTPLTLIEGYAGMLQSSLNQHQYNEEIYTSFVNGIRGGTTRLRAIINDMIDVSLIDNQLLKLNQQPVWLSQIFKTLAADNKNIFEARKLTFTIIPFDGFQDLLMNDPERLLQVFRNILSNAIKFTPDEGKITIDGRKLPGFIEVKITDTGIGIAPEEQTLIFKKFSQPKSAALHSSGKTKFKGGGPGLGLHIAQGIIEAMNGTIWAESEGLDENTFPGSTFHVLIPVTTPKH